MPKDFTGDDKDILAKFVFYYTSAGALYGMLYFPVFFLTVFLSYPTVANVKLLTKPPPVTQNNNTARARKRVRRNSPETGIRTTSVSIPTKTGDDVDEKDHIPLPTTRPRHDDNSAGPSSKMAVKTEPANHKHQAEIDEIDETIKALKARRRALRQVG